MAEANGTATGRDVHAIKALIARQFASLTWSSGTTGNWGAFASDFLPAATLYPAARPPKAQTVAAFVQRMQTLAATSLSNFQEAVVGDPIVHVFGNVAVAVAVCEIVENNADTNRGVEMMLLLKDDGMWRIAAQAWDTENVMRRIADELLNVRAT
jgi:hypothetical protein